MAHPRMVDTYLRELLNQAFDRGVEVEGRAYILPLRAEPVVQVIGDLGNGLRVQVTARVATDVTVGLELYAALNEVNADLAYGRVFLIDDTVWVEDTVFGEQLDRSLLDNAISLVCWATRALGAELAAVGDGRPTVTDTPQDAHGQAPGVDAPATDPGHVQVELLDPADGLLADAGPTPKTGTAQSVGNAAGYL
jgi:hypothetical protein